jgi:hypothetical protein
MLVDTWIPALAADALAVQKSVDELVTPPPEVHRAAFWISMAIARARSSTLDSSGLTISSASATSPAVVFVIVKMTAFPWQTTRYFGVLFEFFDISRFLMDARSYAASASDR